LQVGHFAKLIPLAGKPPTRDELRMRSVT
jgi:hypothetical protein